MSQMAFSPLSCYARSTPTVVDCKIHCSARTASSSLKFNWRHSSRGSIGHGSGPRESFRISSRGSTHFGYVDCKQKRWRDSDLEFLNSCIWNMNCPCGNFGRGEIRAQHLGFETKDGMRRMSPKNPMAELTAKSPAGQRGKSYRKWTLYASLDLYEALGVPSTASQKEIKQAYRRLALKLHPDVNNAPDAQQQFMRIKNAYQALSDDKIRAKYDASKRASPSWDPFSWEKENNSAQKPKEEFYGFEEFFKDVAVSIEDFFRDLEVDSRRQVSKPKSLWEELADIGEEFVEFLEKELNISDTDEKEEKTYSQKRSDAKTNSKYQTPRDPEAEKANVEREIAEIENMLAQLKKELGK